MDGQGAALDEAFITPVYGAMVWLRVGMGPVVSTKVGFAIEGLSAGLVWLFSTRRRTTELMIEPTLPHCAQEHLNLLTLGCGIARYIF
jgi:hypothetical protein